ncbi:MAG: hypothetical protein NTY19_46320 [Planctomycetota bacterium]|nr:hypothetical protein [Planctomycetota bacterium]
MPESGADTCRKLVTPKIYAAGWTDEQISEQATASVTTAKVPFPAIPSARSPVAFFPYVGKIIG